MPGEFIQEGYHILIACIGCPVLAWVFSFIYYKQTARIPVSPDDMNDQANFDQPINSSLDDKRKEIYEIYQLIFQGAQSFLWAEYRSIAFFVVGFSIFLEIVLGVSDSWIQATFTVIAFIVGCGTSVLAGYVGMAIGTFANARTAIACSDQGLAAGFRTAFKAACVMGFCLCAFGIFNLYILIMLFRLYYTDACTSDSDSEDVTADLFEAIAGYGLGGSSVALFGRVGGGIYTKAADVGADLAGKNDHGLDEDDYRNPACIADNVGDNVGDIAGMGADLFGSLAESTCAALVLAAANATLAPKLCSLLYPVMLSSAGIFVGLLTLLITPLLYKIDEPPSVEKALKGVLVISTVLMTPAVIALSYYCLPESFVDGDKTVKWWYCALSVGLGLWSGLAIGFVTEYYTSHSYVPVREIANTDKQSAATGIIYGLALGYLSCIVPVFCLAITILVAHSLCNMFGVALGALGMLGTLTMGLTIDAYGPISDNAGGVAEMSGMPSHVRTLTDCLDAAGNTTAAIGKGFAIGSAALVSLALFGAFAERAEVTDVNILDAWVFTGLLLGAMMPYAFAAWTMKSVGKAANDMVEECNKQFPLIMAKVNPMPPDYEKCIAISTQASLREMIHPGALVILSPLVAGFGFGKNACAGMLSGALVSSVQLAISMSNTGGAWDNAKKYISSNGLNEEAKLKGEPQNYGKGSEAYKNAVTGDTVGDPLKDTSGPALNIVMKLTAIISLVFATKIGEHSAKDGGPFWLEPMDTWKSWS